MPGEAVAKSLLAWQASITSSDKSKIIGKGGINVQTVRSQTKCTVQVQPDTVIVKGENAEDAKKQINDLVGGRGLVWQESAQ
jgi:rRNA processing protein Krr1/Pno1